MGSRFVQPPMVSQPLTIVQQKVLSNMLFSKCKRKNSGMLLNHFMGTGKTRAAITIARNSIPGMASKLIIVGPEGLDETWKEEMEIWNASMDFMYIPFTRISTMYKQVGYKWREIQYKKNVGIHVPKFIEKLQHENVISEIGKEFRFNTAFEFQIEFYDGFIIH